VDSSLVFGLLLFIVGASVLVWAFRSEKTGTPAASKVRTADGDAGNGENPAAAPVTTDAKPTNAPNRSSVTPESTSDRGASSRVSSSPSHSAMAGPPMQVEAMPSVPPQRAGVTEEDGDVMPGSRGYRLLAVEDDCPVPELGHEWTLSHAARTDLGKRRKNNEDAYLCASPLFVVADGMGGYHGGEVASGTATATLQELLAAPRTSTGSDGEALESRLAELREVARAMPVEGASDGPPAVVDAALALIAAVAKANTRIVELAKSSEEYRQMGTTIVAAHFLPPVPGKPIDSTAPSLLIASIGDSRCYRYRQGKLRQMTHDHTMKDFGLSGAFGERLSRALGVAQEVQLDLLQTHVAPGDVYLLCSDGLTKMVADRYLRDLLEIYQENPEGAAEALIEEANERGGKDNVTAIVIRVSA
jgi:serine/threonine protein phosphatase PrpC